MSRRVGLAIPVLPEQPEIQPQAEPEAELAEPKEAKKPQAKNK